ncbi:MAG: hypothetical protein K8U57_04310 [Planctomycetes bacterium]|nr:hypothetical protein [Planctomycetota bacterium]
MSKKSPSENGAPVNKSDAIRDYLGTNPKANSKEVVAALGEKGIKVAPSLIYFVKSRASHAKRKARREQMAEGLSKSGVVTPVDLVIRVKNLANEVGGIKNLKKLVDVLAE